MLKLEGIIQMNSSRFLAPLSLVLALSAIGAAQAQAPALAAGTYKVAVGSKAPCDVTVTADGAFTPTEGCLSSANLAKWTPTSTGYELITTSGVTYAVVKPKGEALEGVTFADQRKITLTH
jgi:hypothetical protein